MDFYKGKSVEIRYKVNQNEKIVFADDANKLSLILYFDGFKMSDLVKYRF